MRSFAKIVFGLAAAVLFGCVSAPQITPRVGTGAVHQTGSQSKYGGLVVSSDDPWMIDTSTSPHYPTDTAGTGDKQLAFVLRWKGGPRTNPSSMVAITFMPPFERYGLGTVFYVSGCGVEQGEIPVQGEVLTHIDEVSSYFLIDNNVNEHTCFINVLPSKLQVPMLK